MFLEYFTVCTKRHHNYWFNGKFDHKHKEKRTGNIYIPLGFSALWSHSGYESGEMKIKFYDFCTVHRNIIIQSGARKTGPPSRRPTWALVSDSVQEIKQMQMQSTYWLEKVLKMISLYVNALLCTLQHIVIHAMQLSGVNSENFQHLL